MEQQKKIYFSIIEYSQSPGPRYCAQGDDSGEDFYHHSLNGLFAQAFQENALLVITLDGADGYASSFLDEAFGNLVYDYGLDTVKDHLFIISNDEEVWIDMITNETYKEWEKRRLSNEQPHITEEHEAWFRLLEGSLKLNKWITLS